VLYPKLGKRKPEMKIMATKVLKLWKRPDTFLNWNVGLSYGCHTGSHQRHHLKKVAKYSQLMPLQLKVVVVFVVFLKYFKMYTIRGRGAKRGLCRQPCCRMGGRLSDQLEWVDVQAFSM
jgi:hypothetical protein